MAPSRPPVYAQTSDPGRGILLRLYEPLRPMMSLMWGIGYFLAAIACLAPVFYFDLGFWGLLFVAAAFACLIGGTQSFWNIFRRPKMVGVYDRGILIGPSFIRWVDIVNITCIRTKFEGDHGAKYSTKWVFHRKDGLEVELETGLELWEPESRLADLYLDIKELNQLLRKTGIPFQISEESIG